MQQELERILNELKDLKVPISKIESDLGFSNGLLGKAKKGDTNLSEEKFLALQVYYQKIKNPAEPPTLSTPKPVIEKKSTAWITPEMRAFKEKVDKDWGEGVMQFLGESPLSKPETVSTGSVLLDNALGIGGFPRGRVVEISGWQGSGKTTLTLHTIADAQRQNLNCMFVDAEHTFDFEKAIQIGVNVDELALIQPDYGEQALEIVNRAVAQGFFGVIVVDSVAALVPKAELEGEIGDSKMGAQARIMSQALRVMSGSISKSNTLLIFINQMRNTIGNPYGNSTVTTGGNALGFYASVRVEVAKIAQIKDGDTIIGLKIKAKVTKNKCAPPFKIAEFDLLFNKGFDQVGELVDLATEKNIIQKNGSWYSHKDSKLGQGRDNIITILKDNPELLQEIEKQVKS